MTPREGGSMNRGKLPAPLVRPKAAAARLPPGRGVNKDFLLALAADFKKHGAAAIEKVRKQQPAAYMKICAFLVPREMKVEHSNAIKDLTDEQLEAMIEYLKASLEAQAQSAKVIEGEAEVVPSLPVPAAPKAAS